jgi:hypothetical protein
VESINVVVDNSVEEKKDVDEEEGDDTPQQTDVQPNVPHNTSDIMTNNTNSESPQVENIIGNLNEGVVTRSKKQISNSCFISKIEPKNVKEALTN